jgi:uncharacterized repeat protein (TIGR01451 family)
MFLCVLQVDQPITPQNKADIALNKTVSPPFEGNNQNSSTLLVGSEFTFRVRVEVQGERTNFAEKVVMTDNLPPGLQFVSLSEQPSDRGKSRVCSYSSTSYDLSQQGVACTYCQG